jgi:hypothetical protein
MSAITVERSQREAGGQVWWWLTGDTYPHRELLKRHGARFSSRRKQWYFIGAELPAAIRALVTSEAQSGTEPSDNEPCTVDEAAAILGVQIKSAPLVEPPPRLFALHDTAYARHELETADGKPIPTGTRGKIVRLYHHNAKHGWSYDVDFEQIGVCWSFERELTPHEPIPGIKVVRGAVVPPGAVLPPTDAEIKRTMLEYGQQPPPIDEVKETDDQLISSVDEPPPVIRVMKPTPMPADGEPLDTVQTAIRTIKTQPFASVQRESAANGRTAPIEQTFVGELTGSITGNVWCYGYAVHEGVCVYLNMGGPRMAVEAIRARLSKGDQVTVVPWDAPSVELTAGEGNSGMYHAYLHYLPEARFASLLLVHDWAVTPLYGGKATTFIFRTSDAQASAKLKHHVTQLVNIPVFDVWSTYLYNAGQKAMLVRKARSAGGIDLLSVDLDIDAWTRLITGGIEQNIIALPVTAK